VELVEVVLLMVRLEEQILVVVVEQILITLVVVLVVRASLFSSGHKAHQRMASLYFLIRLNSLYRQAYQ
jgi:hypothetical protein